MNQEEQYDHIRPYRDHEIQPVFRRLLEHPLIKNVISFLFPDVPREATKAKILGLKTIFGFQAEIIYPAFKRLLQQTSSGFTYGGLDKLDKDKACLFISNHEDITLDPMLIDFALYESGLDTVEIAIGDNLLGETWIRDLVRLNKSFIVHRNLPPRELVKASRLLSSYIHYTVADRGQSIWIAQREGRAKDGYHKTQPGLLHMLAMAAEKDIATHFKTLNIVPVSISYELDPCAVDKVLSLFAERYLGGYKKREGEDQIAMKKGIMGKKGQIHIEFGKPLNAVFEHDLTTLSKQELIHSYCTRLDAQIMGNYRLFKTNYIASDLIHNTEQYTSFYTPTDKEIFAADVDARVAQLDGDKAVLKNLFLEKYAAPVASFETLQKESRN